MISIEEIQKIANLSQLNLSSEEEKKYQKELSSILEFFEKLNTVNTDNVKPLYQVTGIENNLRKDKIESFDAKKLLECSPREKSQNMVSVPAVF